MTCNRATKPFYANDNEIKVNTISYSEHLFEKVQSMIEDVKKKDWIFIQDGTPSHRSNMVQTVLTEKLKINLEPIVPWLQSPQLFYLGK